MRYKGSRPGGCACLLAARAHSLLAAAEPRHVRDHHEKHLLERVEDFVEEMCAWRTPWRGALRSSWTTSIWSAKRCWPPLARSLCSGLRVSAGNGVRSGDVSKHKNRLLFLHWPAG